MAKVFVKGQAAIDELMSRDPGMADWQAKQALATARTYSVNNIPVNDYHDVIGIEWLEGTFAIGPYVPVIK